MQQVYTLLRNNRQTGPYSQEELLRLSLQPTDLLWVEGQSAGWRYPGEIEALKPFLAQPAPPTPPNNRTTTGEPRLAAADKKENKPSSGKHIYVSLPAEQRHSAHPAASAATGERQLSFEERVERMQQRIAAVASGETAQPEDDAELNTKYSRSLQDIKEEYATWLDQQKKKGKRTAGKKQLLAGALLLVVLISVFWAGRMIRNDKQASPLLLADQTEEMQRTAAYNGQLTEETVNLNTITPYRAETEGTNLPGKTEEHRLPDSATPVPEKQTTQKVEANDVQRPIPATKPAKKTAPKAGNREAANAAAEEVLPDTVQKSPVADKAPAANASPAVPLPRQVHLSQTYATTKGDRGVTDLKLTIHNSSNQLLTTVAVDVYYYHSSKRLLRKQTVYFNNVAPNSTYSVYAPPMKRAATVTSEIGLISSNNTLYYTK